MNIRTITATRYVTPLHEGGSLPAIVEADDDGMYVLKFRGAGQGPKVLVAELIAGEIARAAGLPIPEIVFMELPAEMARTEPDPEIQDLIKASAGLNLALDYLPGSVMFDPVAEKVDAHLASAVVWFDAFVTNVDRTPRNTNMLIWHRQLQLIDHGAALYFHHSWSGDIASRAADPFPLIKDHVLLSFASEMAAADSVMSGRVTPQVIQAAVRAVPSSWLIADGAFGPDEQRAAYVNYLTQRLQSPRSFVEEVMRARAQAV